MSFKTCPHCGMRLVDSRYIEEEEDLEDRIIMLLQHVSPEYLEDALAVARDIIESSPAISTTRQREF